MILILPLKKIADKLKIYDGVKKIQETEEFLTIKDHKEVLPHTLSFRLLNPSKSDIGKISKSLLDAMNENILKYSNVNQWKNTAEVITCFTNIKSKKNSSLLNLDVENFYPSISIDLFTDAISYTKIITSIDDDQLSIIIQSRKTLIFNNIEPYVKKLGKKNLTLRWIVKIACGGL